MSSAQDTISDILNSDVPPQITVENIIEEVARTYGVEPEDIRSLKSRKASLSNARHIAIYITRNLTNLVVKQIGDEFGGRHYSTVLHSINHVEELMKKDLKVKETVEDIIKTSETGKFIYQHINIAMLITRITVNIFIDINIT